MKRLNAVIDKAAAVCRPPNDSALATRLHVSRSAVSLWRKGGAISEKHLTALVAVADIDAATVVEVLAEQAATKPQKAIWGELQRRLAAVAALGLCAVLISGNALLLSLSEFSGRTLPIMSNIKWWFRLIRLWLPAGRTKGPYIEARTCEA